MAGAGCVVLLVAQLSLGFALAHDHSGETDTYHVSVGHLFVLRCPEADANTSVTWSSNGRHNQSLPTGVEVRDGLLWFLPVQMSHTGSYTCEKRSGFKMNFWVSVSSGECPDPPENKIIPPGFNGILPCKQDEILRLNHTSNVRWMKECKPVERMGEPISVHGNGFMRLPAASERDAGKYTCLVDIILDGRKYTSARSIQVKIETNESIVFIAPVVESPQNKVVQVAVGKRVELKCLALIGYSEDSETSVYWTVDSMHTDDLKGLNESCKYIHEGKKVYQQSILSISEVPRQFLNVPIRCHVRNPAEESVGLLWLQEADHSALHTSVALCLAASLFTLALAAAFLLFKVDLVLAYRKVLRQFTKHEAPDGKLYDAYVSVLNADTSSAETASFAMQILPEELEKQHGYRLYIRGRDDCPGEAVHDVIAATLHQSRRLIIILSCEMKLSNYSRQEGLLCDYQSQLCYEQKIGLYDALTKNDLKVILVEIDGPVDYSCLPESLQYIKRKQGSLKWKRHSNGTHKLTKLCTNRNFWKNLRYHMPSVPARSLHSFV